MAHYLKSTDPQKPMLIKKQFRYIDTYSAFIHKPLLYRDQMHPSNKGTATIVTIMKNQIGLVEKSPQQKQVLRPEGQCYQYENRETICSKQ